MRQSGQPGHGDTDRGQQSRHRPEHGTRVIEDQRGMGSLAGLASRPSGTLSGAVWRRSARPQGRSAVAGVLPQLDRVYQQ